MRKLPAKDGFIRVFLSLLIMAALAVDILRGNVTQDMHVFFPAPETVDQTLAMSLLGREADSNTLVAAISGDPIEKLVNASQKMVSALRKSGLFSKVVNGATDTLAGTDDPLFAYRYHLAQPGLSQRLSEPGLTEQLKERVAELQSPAGPLVRNLIPHDPTGEWLRTLATMTPQNLPESEDGIWVSPDHKRSLMLLRFSSEVSSFGQRQAAIHKIEEIHQQVAADTHLELNGAPILALASRDMIQRDARLLSLIGTLAVLLFLRLALGSWRHALVLGWPLAAGVVVALASVLLVFGQIHGITIAFGVTLLGVAIDYPVHAFLHQDSRRSIWPTLSMGLISTLLAFLSLTLSGIEGLRQLGVFAATGLMMAAAVTRWLLPSLSPRGMHGPATRWLHWLFFRLFVLMFGLRRLTFVVLAVVAGYLFWHGVDMDLDFARLNPLPEHQKQQLAQLQKDLKDPDMGQFLAAVGDDTETVLREQEKITPRLEQMIGSNTLGGSVYAAQFLPSIKSQQERLGEIPDADRVQQNLGHALADVPFKSGVFAPFLTDIKMVKTMPPLTATMASGSLLGERISPLLLTAGKQAAGLIQLIPPVNEAALQKLAGNTPNLWFVNLRQTTTVLLEQEIRRGIALLFGGMGLIFVMLVWRYSFPHALGIVVAPVFAIILILALAGLSGITLNLFHLVSLLLVFGLGLDYALFFYFSTQESSPDSTFRSLWISATTTILVFGVLAISATPALRAIGLTVSFGAFFSLILAASVRSAAHNR